MQPLIGSGSARREMRSYTRDAPGKACLSGAAVRVDKSSRFEPGFRSLLRPLDVVTANRCSNTHGMTAKRTPSTWRCQRGQRIPVELKRAGTVRVDCDAHGWMEGWIYVVDNPYYAVTGADGKFTISDVPPGEYKLVAVQSFTGPIEMPVTVKGGESTKLEIELKK